MSPMWGLFFFFFNDTATTEIYTLSLHDALPISRWTRARFEGQILPPMPGHQPYVPATQSPAELTARALVLGVLLGLIFSASSVYLALKIGLTVSSSIPIAVLSITIFRALGRTSILENNIVQTTGS